jgi:hypothetical protein
MNPRLVDALADAHLREVRRQAAQHRIRRAEARSPGREERWRRLRSRVGFLLVEAGFHLLAMTGSMPRD